MKILLLIPFITILSACMHEADKPRDVASRYWQAIKDGDTDSARKMVSSSSQAEFDNYIAKPADEKIPVGEIKLGAEKTTVVTLIYPQGDNPDDYSAFDTTLVLENGQWKIDAAQTVIPRPPPSERELEELADQLSESMQENVDSIEEAMNEGLNLLNEALREGSRDMGESMLKGMEEMNRALQESIEDMQKRREQEQPQPSQEKEEGEGLI
ncbi:MAG: hypothetical protein KJP10_11260 [Gammaproteobacteria bacterium]|nr:hypothetical protein [Gammaproteobacteria bacterium]